MENHLTFYKNIFKKSLVGMAIYDSSGQCIDCNNAICKIINATNEQVLSQNYYHLESWKKSGLKKKAIEALATNKSTQKQVTLTSTFNKKLTANATFSPLSLKGETFLLCTFDDLTAYEELENKIHQTTYDLNERVKELNCLYGLLRLAENEDHTIGEIFQGVVDLIPSSWQYPEVTCAQLKIAEQTYRTDNFRETDWFQSQGIITSGKKTGVIEIYYLEEKPEIDEGPFLKEERYLINAIAERLAHIIQREHTKEQVRRFNKLREELFGLVSLETKLERITDTVVDVFDADFCRIWIVKPGDLCHSDCPHADVMEGPHVCRQHDRCLHLAASSGRYSGLDSKMHGRVPFGCYKIGRIASGDIKSFITNDVTNDSRVHNHAWARQLGLVSFAGFSLFSEKGDPLGVLGLFSKQGIESNEFSLLDGLANNISQIIHVDMAKVKSLKLEAQLQQAQKMEAIGTLAGGIAHDFNNILSAIIGSSKLAKQDLPEDSSVVNDIDEVIRSSRRAADLVQQILTFSRKTEQDLQSLNPHLIVKEALRMLRSSLPSTIIIHEDIDKGCGKILADPTNIHQIVMNLSTNALHAMAKETGTLTIKLYHRELAAEEIVHKPGVSAGPFVVLAVSDTGHGMDEATKEHIFEPYFTTKETGKGTGLGLAVVHGIIQDCKGFVKIESTVGEGSTFFIYIPALQEETSRPEYSALKESGHKITLPTGNERILIVDDEPLLVKINEKQLERCGYIVTGTTDSRDALEKIRAQPEEFDLLITDQTMPGLSGVELAMEVQKINPALPVILCTGHSDVVSKEDALAMGIKKYVSKPIYRDELFLATREVLDEK